MKLYRRSDDDRQFPGLALIGPWVNRNSLDPAAAATIKDISYTFFLINFGAIFGYLAE